MVLALPGIEPYATRFAQQVLSQLSYTPIREFAFFQRTAVGSPTGRSLKTEQQKILKVTSVSFGLLIPRLQQTRDDPLWSP